MNPLKALVEKLDGIRARIHGRRVRKALPTLKALCTGGYHYYSRSVERLWLDGGSVKGFEVCMKLGWAEIRREVEGERQGKLTSAGIAEAEARGMIEARA